MSRAELQSSTRHGGRQWLRFIMVGVINTAFSYAVYAMLLFAGLPYGWANLGALLLGIPFSFRTQGRWVFGNADWRRFARFVPVWGVIFGVNLGLIALGLRVGLNAYTAGALALVPVTVLSFVLQKFFVFTLALPDARDADVLVTRP